MMFCEVVVPRSNHARDVPVLQVLLVSCQELLAAKSLDGFGLKWATYTELYTQ